MSDKELVSERRVTTAQKLREWARGLKREVIALYYAMKHPRTPWYAKVAAAVVVGYALSPIDLIPDFIPVLGYLDDVILLPIGIALVIRLIPPDVWSRAETQWRKIRLLENQGFERAPM